MMILQNVNITILQVMQKIQTVFERGILQIFNPIYCSLPIFFLSLCLPFNPMKK